MSSTDPSSMQLQEMQKVAAQLQIVMVVTSLFIGATLGDFVQVIFDEVRYIFIPELRKCWQKRKIPSLPTIALLAIRLLTIPMMTLFLICLTGNAMSAPLKVSLYKVYLYLQATAGVFANAIFVLRTIAIREAGLPLKTCLWIYLFGFCAYGYAFIIMATVPGDLFSVDGYSKADTEEADMLIRSSVHDWTILLSLIIAFDVGVFLLCLETRISKFRWVSSRSQVARTFYLDAFWYFGVTTTVTCVELIWIYIKGESRIYIALVVPIQSWVTLSISPRVIRRLKLYAAKQEYENDRRSKAYSSASPDSTKTHFSSAQVPGSKLTQQTSAASSNNKETTIAQEGVSLHSVVVTLRSPPASSEEFQAGRTRDRTHLCTPVSYP